MNTNNKKSTQLNSARQAVVKQEAKSERERHEV